MLHYCRCRTKTVPLPELRKTIYAALSRAGCDHENADAVAAAVMAAADSDGCASHGVFRLAGYLASLKSGKVDGKARPSVTSLAPGVVKIHGRGGFAPLAMKAARDALAPLARGQGIAAATLVNVHHFSALWVDVEPLVEAGLAAMCFTAYMPSVAPAGARKPFFGTNPMAFGWPRADGGTLIFDQASAAMARGEIYDRGTRRSRGATGHGHRQGRQSNDGSEGNTAGRAIAVRRLQGIVAGDDG